MKLNRLNKISLMLIAIFVCMIVLSLSIASAQTKETIYYGAPNGTFNKVIAKTERANDLNYTRKEILIDSEMPIMLPQYYDKNASLTNGCPAVAGAILIGYYDMYKENLIPNFTSFIKRGNNVIFKPTGNEVQLVMNDLFNKMNVNKVQPGATEEDFKQGLKNYVQTKGYNIDYNTYGNSNSVDYNAIVQSINNGNPMAIFTGSGSIITDLNITDTKLTMTTSYHNANHIFIANGIKQLNYYNGNSLIRTDTYLKVSTGLENALYGYILIEDIRIDNILGVVID